jgi:hypothetical protein
MRAAYPQVSPTPSDPTSFDLRIGVPPAGASVILRM